MAFFFVFGVLDLLHLPALTVFVLFFVFSYTFVFAICAFFTSLFPKQMGHVSGAKPAVSLPNPLGPKGQRLENLPSRREGFGRGLLLLGKPQNSIGKKGKASNPRKMVQGDVAQHIRTGAAEKPCSAGLDEEPGFGIPFWRALSFPKRIDFLTFWFCRFVTCFFTGTDCQPCLFQGYF